MNSEEVPKNTIFESPRSPRKVVRKLAWHEGRKDTSNSDGRQSGVSSCQHVENCCDSNEGDVLPKIDYRIQGLPHSTDEQEDDTRKEVVNKLIHQFETPPDREAFENRSDAKSSVQPIQRKIEELDPQHGFTMLDERHCVLYLRNLPVSHRKNAENEPGSI